MLFLRRIEQVYRTQEIHIILDNSSTYTTPKVERWFARRPRFHRHFTPTGSSWLNQIEAWFSMLSRRDSHYHPRYFTEKPPVEKDLAYHQGTVCPWLMGAYADALVKVRTVEGRTKNEIEIELRDLLFPLVEFLMTSPQRSLPEVFDGDEPHRPGSTRSQAWSVAEIFRVLVEHLNIN